MTNLKLQELLYYVQGFGLALNNRPVFNERIIAWRYGPVVPEIYHQYKSYGSDGIDCPEDFDYDQIDQGTQELIDEVYEVYGIYTAPALMRITHEEPPWMEVDLNEEITTESMRAYFVTQLVDEAVGG